MTRRKPATLKPGDVLNYDADLEETRTPNGEPIVTCPDCGKRSIQGDPELDGDGHVVRWYFDTITVGADGKMDKRGCEVPDPDADVTALAVVSTTTALDDLAGRIRAEHEQVGTALRITLGRAIHCGELLIEAKAQVPHGGWLPWLKEHCAMTERTAQGYMRVARERDRLNTQSFADLGVGEALARLAEPRDRTDIPRPIEPSMEQPTAVTAIVVPDLFTTRRDPAAAAATVVREQPAAPPIITVPFTPAVEPDFGEDEDDGPVETTIADIPDAAHIWTTLQAFTAAATAVVDTMETFDTGGLSFDEAAGILIEEYSADESGPVIDALNRLHLWVGRMTGHTCGYRPSTRV